MMKDMVSSCTYTANAYFSQMTTYIVLLIGLRNGVNLLPAILAQEATEQVEHAGQVVATILRRRDATGVTLVHRGRRLSDAVLPAPALRPGREVVGVRRDEHLGVDSAAATEDAAGVGCRVGAEGAGWQRRAREVAVGRHVDRRDSVVPWQRVVVASRVGRGSAALEQQH